jgi:hypothetical protein
MGPDGLSLASGLNYSWSEGSGNAYAVLFRQRNTAATVVASGYKRSGTAGFASSFGTSMARAAIAVGSNNGSIAFFSDSATNVANGTDITPTERMTILNNGNVGIGTTSPGVKLVNSGATLASAPTLGSGTIGANAILSANGLYGLYTGVASEGWVWQQVQRNDGNTSVYSLALQPSGGNVGIGTTSPVQKLHVEGSTAIGTTGTEDILLLGRALGGGVSFQQAASLKLGRYQNAGGGYESYTRLDFALRDNSAASNYNTNTTVMTLTNAGNVGIGTTNPEELLDIRGANRDETSAQYNQVIYSTSTHGINRGGSIGLGGTSNGTSSITAFGAIKGGKENDTAGNTAGALLFLTRVNAGPITEKMRITSGATVYINTTTNPVTDNAQPQLGILAGSGTDAINIKHTQNANNTVNIWQTGTTSHSAIAFYKGDTQTNRGLITVTTSGTTYNSVSDYRLKENIVPLENGLDRVLQLKPSKFNWIETGNETEGFIAHELQEYFPDAVTGEKDAVYSSTGNIKPQSVDYGRITPLLVKAIQEQQAQIESLKAEIQTLKQ